MKVGDLVERSARSKKSEHLRWVPKNALGIVIGKSEVVQGVWKVLWIGRGGETSMRRSWLKHARIKK